MKTLKFIDMTLRQAGPSFGKVLSFKEKLEIARSLDRLRADTIELAPISGSKADQLAINPVVQFLSDLSLVQRRPVLRDDVGRRRVLEQAEGRRQLGAQEHAEGPARIAAMLPVDPYFVGPHLGYRHRGQMHDALLQMAGIRCGVVRLRVTAALVEPAHLIDGIVRGQPAGVVGEPRQ